LDSRRLGIAILVGMVLLGWLVPLVSPYDPSLSSSALLSGPSGQHPFGTDHLGRDVLVRSFAAAQLDLLVAFAGVSVPLVIGTFIGALVGTSKVRLVTSSIGIVIEGINAFPFLILVVAIVGVIGPGVEGLLIALAATGWARYARLARSRATIVGSSDFIAVTSVLGYSRLRILVVHVFPNILPESIAYGISDLVLVVSTVAGLSFLGAGVRPPAAEWGAMMAEGRLYLFQAWWATVFPGLLLTMTSIAATLIALGSRSRSYGGQ
jgi:peptide/nickel transport system permease protein